MTRFALLTLALAFLASCGADGAPVRPEGGPPGVSIADTIGTTGRF